MVEPMNESLQHVKKLYKDAAYYHLLHQGCSDHEAKLFAKRLCL
jgi:hypothetical protein